MVDSVANVLLETLRDVLVEEVRFLSGVSDEVKKVEGDLRTIHDLLMEADRQGCDSPTLRTCIHKLKDLAFQAENVLETYAVEVESKKEGKSLKKKLRRFMGIFFESYNVHEVGKDTQALRSRLADLTNEFKSDFGQQAGSSHSADEDQRHVLRLEYAHEDEQHFVGMKKDIDLLVSMVKAETRVVSICGMGGLGKTTLARKIYNHKDVECWFDARAWVCVTQQFQAKTVLSNIWKQLDKKEEIDSMGVPELVEGIHNFLVQRKCLILIDDIWENDDWDILKPAFPKNCRVVVTTRSEHVAFEEHHLHKLGYLTEDEGWELLQKIALPADHAHAPEALEDTGRQIVRKCGGLPLSISVIGGMLRQKQPIFAEWNKVSVNMDSYLRHGEGVKHNRGVEQVLELSYDVLPYYLKPCFLYLGCFPEDQEIGTEKLYFLWMAEGLISYEQKGRNESLRDVAERYLSELAMRCMIQVQKGVSCSPRWRFSSCRLHDLMHDLCSSKAEEDKFFKRIEVSKHPHGVPSSIDTSISRLVISVDEEATTFSLNGIEKLEDLRSFLVLEKDGYYGKSIQLGNFQNYSKYLRTLVLDRCEFEGGKLPSKVGKLIHLRYLSLFKTNVRELPQSVFDLPYLHTLDLRVWDTIKLPNAIWKLKRLRHLFLPRDIEVIGGEKLRLDELKELETLEDINSKSVCIADIPKLINLRSLCVSIEDMNSFSVIVHQINNQSRLCEVELTLVSLDLSSEEGSNNLKNVLMSPSLVSLILKKCNISGSFPCYEQGMCQNLKGLSFDESKVGGDVMEELGKYPMLQLLILVGAEVMMKTETIFRPNSFPELKHLRLLELPNLKKWEVEERALPKLVGLWIFNCINLEKIPDGLKFISTLRKLETYGMPEEFNDRIRIVNGKAGEDYHKVCHIPSFEIF